MITLAERVKRRQAVLRRRRQVASAVALVLLLALVLGTSALLRSCGSNLGGDGVDSQSMAMDDSASDGDPGQSAMGESTAEITPLGVVQRVPVREPIGELHLEVDEQRNQMLVIGADDQVVRRIPVAGDPDVPKPRRSTVGDRIKMSADYDYDWHLPWFVRLIEGRGIGTHAIPLSTEDGNPAMQAVDLGKSPDEAPRSHGCLRMHEDNARWVYDNVPPGTPVYWFNGA